MKKRLAAAWLKDYLLPLLAGSAIAFAGLFLWQHYVTSFDLVVDARVERGNFFELYRAAEDSSPLRIAVQPGQWKRYEFSNLSLSSNRVRLDPSDATGARVEIEKVELSKRGQLLASMGRTELQDCDLHNAHAVAVKKGLAFVSEGNDPYLFCRLPALSRGLFRSDNLLSIFVISLLVAMVLSASTSTRKLLCASIVMGLILNDLMRLSYRHLVGFFGSYFDVSQSIGMTNYSAYPKVADLRYYSFEVWAPVLLGSVLLFLIWKALGRRVAKPLPQAEPLKRWEIWALLAAFFALLLLDFPRISETVNELSQRHPLQSFDGANFLAWQYAEFRGWLPFRDFWYPYAGSIHQISPFPPSLMLAYSHQSLILLLLGLSLFRLMRKSFLATFSTLFLLYFLGQIQWVQTIHRYFAPMVVFLFFVAYLPRKGRPSMAFAAIFAALTAWLFYYEPNQLIYAGLACALAFVAQFWSLRKKPALYRDFMVGILYCAIFCVVFWGLEILILALRGQLAGFWAFYKSLGVLVVHSSITLPLFEWMKFRPDPGHLAVCLCAPLLLIGISLLIPSRGADDIGQAILGLGAMAWLIGVKQVVRPDMGYQYLGYFAVGSCLLAYRWMADLRTKYLRGRRALLFASLALLLFSPPVATRMEDRLRGLSHIGGDLRVLLSWKSALAEESYFSIATFKGDQGRDALIERVQEIRSEPHPKEFYVLGDASYLYIVGREKPYYYVTLYDSSPLAAQRRLLDELALRSPEFLLFDSSVQSFDQLPNIVRSPLLFSFAVSKFVRAEDFGNFHIFHKRAPNEALDLKGWSALLGDEVRLGSIPALSKAARLPICSGKACATVLHLNIEDEQDGKVDRLTWQLGSHSFSASFTELVGHSDYSILVDRLWFAAGLGNPMAFKSNNPKIKASLERIDLGAAEQVLY